MNILYVNSNKFCVEEARALHDMVESKVGKDNLITLPMQTSLLYDVNLDNLCQVRDKLNEIIENKMKDIPPIQVEDSSDKHLKGYMYDSLCYRYQLARYKACEADAMNLVMTKGLSKREAEAKARDLYERDCMRFYQILDEAIGEHD